MMPYQHEVPLLASNQEWVVVGYLYGKQVRQTPLRYEDFKTIQYIGHSNKEYHMIGDGSLVLVCTINFKK